MNVFVSGTALKKFTSQGCVRAFQSKMDCGIVFNGRVRQPNNRGCNQLSPELQIYVYIDTGKCIMLTFYSTCSRIENKQSLENKLSIISWVSTAECLSNTFKWLKLISNTLLLFFKQQGKEILQQIASGSHELFDNTVPVLKMFLEILEYISSMSEIKTTVRYSY